MKVIVLKSMRGREKEGDIIEVKDGYARNYLIPQGFALRATKESFKKLEEIKRRKLRIVEEEKKAANSIKEKIEEISLTITAQVKNDEEIFGSVNDAQVLRCLRDEKVELDASKLLPFEPIKKLGVYNLKIALHPEVEANLRVWVVKK